MKKNIYVEKLKDPRWQKKRLEILNRDEWICQICFDSESTLHVHHKNYRNVDPWDYPNNLLITLCDSCHTTEHEDMPMYLHDLSIFVKEAGFLSKDVENLCTAFCKFECDFPHDVSASIIEKLFSDRDKMNEVASWYFEKIREGISNKGIK